MRRLLAITISISCAHTSPSPTPSPAPAPDPVADPVPAPAPAPAPDPLAARISPVTDVYHGVSVTDSYRWLERDDDPEVKAWSAAQNDHARGILDKLPEVDLLRAELLAIFDAPVTRYGISDSAGGKLFGYRMQPKHEQPELIVLDDPRAVERAKLIFDPAAAGGAQQAIDWFVPSPDGTKVAVSISLGGSENGTLHVLDLDGKELDTPIPNVQRGTGGGSVAWTPDGKGIYYTRYPSKGEKPDDELDFWLQVWFHQLGTPIANDRYEVGKDLPKIAEIVLKSDKRGRVLASVQNGDGGTFRHYLRDAKGWRQLDDFSDAIVAIAFGADNDLWLVSRAGAKRGKVMRLAGNAATAASAKLVIPENEAAVVTSFGGTTLLVTKDRLFVEYQLGGPSELRVFTLAGVPAKSPQLPPVSNVGSPLEWKKDVLVGSTSYTTQWTMREFDPASGKLTELAALSPKLPVDLGAFDVTRELATSKDGTKVPINIVWPKAAKRDGTTPCVLYGYGGYGVNMAPHFLSGYAPLLERGVCYAEANIRGGGEFGDDWHHAGSLVNKQNVFDDFAAAATYLVEHKLTSVPHLALLGGSNGGLLMGAMITQHPEVAGTVVSEVGIYDMLRVETSPNGAYNTTEFGTVKDEAQFKALYAYSPYHHVKAGTKYPAILMTTGANDPRVSPWQSRKMVAALHAVGADVILRTSDKAGHGIGSSRSEFVELLAHVDAYLLAHVR